MLRIQNNWLVVTASFVMQQLLEHTLRSIPAIVYIDLILQCINAYDGFGCIDSTPAALVKHVIAALFGSAMQSSDPACYETAHSKLCHRLCCELPFLLTFQHSPLKHSSCISGICYCFFKQLAHSAQVINGTVGEVRFCPATT